MTQTQDRPTAARINPYPGPRMFTADEADRFYGRQLEARELLAYALSERLLLFYAQSGAGKSSLINARIVPSLTEEGHEVLPIGRVGGAESIALPEGANVFVHNLMNSLVSTLSLGNMPAPDLTLADFLLHLERQADGRYRYRTAQADGVPSSPVETFDLADLDQISLPSLHRTLIIDQFEEILTTNLSAWEQRPDFFRQLAQAMEDDPYLFVILVLREDYVAGLDKYAHMLPGRLRARYNMERMDRQQALDAMTLPARAEGITFAPEAAEALVNNLRQVQVAGKQTALGQYVEPVQLQVVCFQLWESLGDDGGATITLADLERLAGGRSLADFVDQALIDFYTRSLAEVLADPAVKVLPKVSEAALRRWFSRQLITELGTRGFVVQGETHTGGMPNLVLRLLGNRYLLRAENRAGGLWYELVHDRFMEPIRENNRSWFASNQDPVIQGALAWEAVGESKARLLTGAALEEAQAHMEAKHGDYGELERKYVAVSAEAARHQRGIIIGAAALVLLFAGLAGWGVRNSVQATNNANLAVTREFQAYVESARALKAEAAAKADRDVAATRQEEAIVAEAAANTARASADLAGLALTEMDARTDPTGDLALLLAREAVLITWTSRSDITGSTAFCGRH